MLVDTFLRENKGGIKAVVLQLIEKNPDYSMRDIRDMVTTTISGLKRPTLRVVYLQTIKRILEEKGLKYRSNNMLYSPICIDDHHYLEYNPILRVVSTSDKISDKAMAENLLELSALNQDEIFAVTLTCGLSTPDCLGGMPKKKLDNIEPMYYFRPLQDKEISLIMDKPVKEMRKIRKSAITKMKKLVSIHDF